MSANDGIHRVDCPGSPACAHPEGHLHLEASDGCGQVWSADGVLLDPFDLTRPALVPVVRPIPGPRWQGRRRE